MPESSGTHPGYSAPAPGPEIQRLGALAGRWRSEGHVGAEVPVPITGTDVYEWLPGGFFLVHRVDVVIGQQRVQALELLGEDDPATGSFTARAYDNLGNVTVMQASVDEHGVWRFTGGGDAAPAARPGRRRGWAVRSTLTGERRPKRHDGREGAQRRRRHVAAVDGCGLYPDVVTGGGRLMPGCACPVRRAGVRGEW